MELKYILPIDDCKSIVNLDLTAVLIPLDLTPVRGV